MGAVKFLTEDNVDDGGIGLQPAPDLLGWCHNCEGYQNGDQARRLWCDWADEYLWCCRSCDDEPWGLGVWVGSPCQSCRPVFVAKAANEEHRYGGVCRAGREVKHCSAYGRE